MSTSDKVNVPKLQGSINYDVWALRASAFLTKEGLRSTITEPLADAVAMDATSISNNDKALSCIVLLIEDGPLLYIQHETLAWKAWKLLKEYYQPRGFTSDFLLAKQFLDTSLD